MGTQEGPAKTSSWKGGSLTASFSEKLKVASAKASRGDLKDLNIAVLKATTNQFHVVPKEKHVLGIAHAALKLAVQGGQSRRNVLHVISELHRRLQDCPDWLTALKTLITLHRLMRETDPAFMEELVRYSEGQAHTHGGAPHGTRLYNMENFIDRTASEGRFDFSEWVRAYGKYLDEQLTVFSSLKWYVEQETPGVESRMRSLGPRDLLFQLPHLQRLQRRLLDCVPHGAATHDPVVLFALTLVVKESFKVYKAVSEGIINLADAFFEMEYHDATKGLEYYKEGMASSDALSSYYTAIEQIDEIKRSMQLPKLSTPPPDFLASMEAYVAEAPRPLAAEGEAPLPAKKGAPLRKGRLMHGAARRADSGPPAAAAAAGAPCDPGMVVAVPAVPATTAASTSGGAVPAASTSAATATSAQSPKSPYDLLGDTAGTGQETAAAAAAPPAPAAAQKVPSPLDLLSDLDFSFGTAATAGPPATAPAASSNPFADLPVATTVATAPPAAAAAPAPLPAAAGSANPFGEPAPANAGFGSARGGRFDWPPQPQQAPAWEAAPAALHQQQQQQYGQPAPLLQQQQQPGYFYSAALPSPGGVGAHPGVVSDDPFANFAAAPTPSAANASAALPAAAYGSGAGAAAAAQMRSSSSGGAFWGSPGAAVPGSFGAGTPGRPVGTTGDEMSKAALHDPFAALTGLPPKNSPASTGGRPSPPRAGVFPGYY